MRLRKLSVTNFRGIQEGHWDFSASFVALVGPGDSTKTTVLDALGLALTSRYNAAFTDADFYNCDTNNSIVIEAVVVDLPTTLIEERVHGKNRSGIRADGTLEHDPLEEADVEECLVVRLTVDATLEPIWEVVRPGDATGDRISASERAQLGFFRIGDYVDQHLRWGRGSALTTLTSSKTDATHALVEAQRQARQAVRDLEPTPLHEAAKLAQAEVRKLGSGPFKDLRPGLDPSFGAGSSALVLHDGDIPLTQFGLGSRRLLSLSIQENALAGHSIVAIDEVESGLDPHRLAHLIRYLRDRAEKAELQVFLTTHSPLVVEALSHDQLFVVRALEGRTTVTCVPEDLYEEPLDGLQGLMRAQPSSLLARRVVVGEGATEVGFVKALLRRWDLIRPDLEDVTSVTAGAAVSNGGGSDPAPKRARALSDLGYPTLLVIDGDVVSNATLIEEARDAGTRIVQWSSGNTLEDAIVQSLTIVGLQQLVNLAADDRSEDAIWNAVGAQLGVHLSALDVEEWISEHTEIEVRGAIAKASKNSRNGWFKREDRGAQLGELVWSQGQWIKGSEVYLGVQQIYEFVYGPDTKKS